MSTDFVIAAKPKPDRFQDNVSVGDAVTYSFDFTPWQEENNTITSVTWESKYGQVGISNQQLIAGVATALLTYSTRGNNLVAVLATTATQSKKVWLEVKAKDVQYYPDDYGIHR